jgi:hypothetical protein
MNKNRKMLIITALVLLFALVVIVWFFMYAKPVISPSLSGTNNPLPGGGTVPKRFGFLNFGKDEPSSTGTTTTEVSIPGKDPLVLVWNKPATGQTFIVKKILQEVTATATVGTSTILVKKVVEASSTQLLFVDRITGYIFGFIPETNKRYQISNTIIPGVYDAYIFENGTKVLYRYEDQNKHTVVSIVGTIPLVTQNGQPSPLINMTTLPVELRSVALNKKTNLLSYLVTNDFGSSIYTLTSKGPTLVGSSPFREWNLFYSGDTLFATSKPSAYVEGSTVLLPTFETIISSKTGLVSKGSDDGLMINSMWASKGLVAFLSSPSGNTTLASPTLASKCAWGKKNFLVCAVPKLIPLAEEGFPDDWYQGRVFFEDSLSVINTKDGLSYSLFSFESTDKKFDVTNITVSSENDLLSFLRKQDATLWYLNTNLIPSDE